MAGFAVSVDFLLTKKHQVSTFISEHFLVLNITQPSLQKQNDQTGKLTHAALLVYIENASSSTISRTEFCQLLFNL